MVVRKSRDHRGKLVQELRLLIYIHHLSDCNTPRRDKDHRTWEAAVDSATIEQNFDGDSNFSNDELAQREGGGSCERPATVWSY